MLSVCPQAGPILGTFHAEATQFKNQVKKIITGFNPFLFMLIVGIGQRQWTGRLKTKNLGLGGFEPQTSWMQRNRVNL